MINCNYIGENEFQTFEKIITEKNNPGRIVLNGIKHRVESCYEQYLNRFNELETKQSSEFTEQEIDERRHLQGCYSSLTVTGKSIRASIFSEQPTVLKMFCPFCLLDKPRTLDHYIGQDEFPEYSFLVKNLVPCCYDCNQIKTTRWRQNNRRRFIHFYNDNLFDKQFLFAELAITANTPVINLSIVKPQGMTNEDFQIIECHFEDLNLFQQYKERSNSTLSTELKKIKKLLNLGFTNEQIIAQLQTSEKSYAEDYGLNYWKSVMFQCMSQKVDELKAL